MPGIIEQNRQTPITTPGADPADEDAFNTTTGYDPERVEVNEQEDLVSGRLAQILEQNHPLTQAARTRTAQDAQGRGIKNSLGAVQAGEYAALQAGLPIAQGDAATSYDARLRNQAAGNRALEFTAQGQQQLEQQHRAIVGESRLQTERGEIESGLIGERTDAQSRLQAERADIEERLLTADADERARLLELQGQIDTDIQELRNAGALELTELESQWRNIIQTNQSAAVYFSETATAIGSILSNPDIPQNQKQSLIDKQRQLLEQGLNVIGGIADLDLAGLLKFGAGGSDGGTAGQLPGVGGGTPLNQEQINALLRGGSITT